MDFLIGEDWTGRFLQLAKPFPHVTDGGWELHGVQKLLGFLAG
jgi:hypothetical protein